MSWGVHDFNTCLEAYIISIQNFNTSLLKRPWLQYIIFNTSLLSLHAINTCIEDFQNKRKGVSTFWMWGMVFFFFIFNSFGRSFFGWYLTIGSLMRKIQGKIASPKTFIFPSWILIQRLAMSLSRWLFVLMIHYKIMVLDLGIKYCFWLKLDLMCEWHPEYYVCTYDGWAYSIEMYASSWETLDPVREGFILHIFY